MTFKSTAIRAAREAGNLLMQNLGRIKSVYQTEINDYVTNVDVETEQKIREIIKADFPQHTIIGEELGGKDVNSEFTWFIDPISSTSNYLHGLPHFAVSIALRKNGEYILGVVFDPFVNELFYGEKGKGAYLNEKKISVSTISRVSESILCVGVHNKGDVKIDEGLGYMKRMLLNKATLRRIGSIALQICYVASGRLDGHINNHSDPFAIPSGKVILEEAGGIVTDFDNNSWNENSTSVVATNNLIHERIIDILPNRKAD